MSEVSRLPIVIVLEFVANERSAFLIFDSRVPLRVDTPRPPSPLFRPRNA